MIAVQRTWTVQRAVQVKMGGYPSGQREQTVNLLRLRYVGSNPTPPTINGALTLIGKGAVLKTASRRC